MEGDDYQISLVTEDGKYFLRGKRTRHAMSVPQPQILRKTIKVSSAWAVNLLAELQKANIPLMPPEVAGCDGEFYTMSVGSLFGGATYKWWSTPPAGWEILQSVTRQISDEFSKSLPAG